MRKEIKHIPSHRFCLIIIVFCSSIAVQSQTYFGQVNIIFESNELKPSDVFAADINGDDYIDVIVASETNYRLVWHENTDGEGSFGDQMIIAQNAGNVTSIYAADIDGDGDLDVLSATGCHNEIVWYENMNGEGVFGERQIITSEAQYALCVYAADLDSDGDMDVISASRDDNKIAWYKNDGYGDFGEQLVVSTDIQGARSVCASDLDGDEDIDLFSGAYIGNIIAWHENTNGEGDFSEPIIITSLVDNVMSVFASDLDGDEDMDVLSASYDDDKIAWYENTSGEADFGDQQVISPTCDGATDIFSIDLDKDGDLDVISGSIRSDIILWHENIDGSGNFEVEHVISSNLLGPASIYAIDLNSDNNTDILSIFSEDDKVGWFENLTLEIISQPQNQNICPGSNTTFDVLAKNATNYQWQVNEGNGFHDIINNSTYSGATTDKLHIISPGILMSGFQYRCVLSNPGGNLVTNEVVLSIEDTEMPVILSSHFDQVIEANDNCEAILPNYIVDIVVTDNCDDNVDVMQVPSAGTFISGFNNTITIEVTDDANNIADVSFNVEVSDNTKPTITSIYNDQYLQANIDCEAVLPNYIVDIVATDNCDNNVDVIQIPSAGTFISGFNNTITIEVTDDANNIADVSFNVEVSDNTKPTITSIYNDQYLEANIDCEAVLPNYITGIIATDNCANTLHIIQSPVASTLVSGDTNTVIIQVTDNAYNSASVSFNVEVLDILSPELICPDNKTIELEGSNSSYAVHGTEFDPELIEDNCSIKSIRNSFNQRETLNGSLFPVGSTKVVWTLTDNSDNTVECSQNITIIVSSGIKIYPNPTHGILYIDSNQGVIEELKILDINGKPILIEKTKSSKESIDLGTLSSGVYIVKILTNKSLIIRKIVKKK